MSASCNSKGCKMPVPPGLKDKGLCLLHFTLTVEEECGAIRRETTPGETTPERHQELFDQIADRGEALVNVATSGFSMTDEMKARILSTFLTLMNTRESVDRSASRQTVSRHFA
jgi:hypothetical protein